MSIAKDVTPEEEEFLRTSRDPKVCRRQLAWLTERKYSPVPTRGELTVLQALGIFVIRTSLDGVLWAYGNASFDAGYVWWASPAAKSFLRSMRTATTPLARADAAAHAMAVSEVLSVLSQRGEEAKRAALVALGLGLSFSDFVEYIAADV